MFRRVISRTLILQRSSHPSELDRVRRFDGWSLGPMGALGGLQEFTVLRVALFVTARLSSSPRAAEGSTWHSTLALTLKSR
jgi:hypothetical protein